MTAVLSEYYNKEYPEHCRTSCSDDHPINADVNGHGCLRCNALFFEKAERDSETVEALTKSLRGALILLQVPQDQLEETIASCSRKA